MSYDYVFHAVDSSVPPPHQGSVSSECPIGVLVVEEIDVESVQNNKNNRYSADDLSSVLDSYIASGNVQHG